MNDKERDKIMNQVVKNQNQIIKNQNVIMKNADNCWIWVKHLDAKNKAQDNFDKSVVASLKGQDAKIGTVLELTEQVKELTKNNHRHEEVTVKT